MSPTTRRRPWSAQWPTVLWLVVVWVLLWGDLSVANVLAGIAISLLVTRGLRMSPIDFQGTVHPFGLLVLVARFVVDLVHASFQVSLLALRPHRLPHGAVIAVQVRDRPWAAVVADMIEGVVVANQLVAPQADRLRTDLWEAIGSPVPQHGQRVA